MIRMVAKTMDERTSFDASRTTSRAGRGLSRCAFSRSRRKTFSTSTIASSTSSPMATARPPSVIVLTEMSNALNTSAEMTMESGMAVSVIAVVRTLSRNRNSTITTRMAPSRRASSTFPMAASMNGAWRNTSGWSVTPAGSVLARSSSAASICRVSSTVLAPGCFSTETMTPGRPFTPASPRLGAEP